MGRAFSPRINRHSAFLGRCPRLVLIGPSALLFALPTAKQLRILSGYGRLVRLAFGLYYLVLVAMIVNAGTIGYQHNDLLVLLWMLVCLWIGNIWTERDLKLRRNA